MIEAAALNSLLLSAAVLVAVSVSNHRNKKVIADYNVPLDSQSIVALLKRHGVLSSVMGSWVVFDNQGKEYAINISKLPVLVIIKQTSLEDYQDNVAAFQEIAQTLSLDTVMASIHVDGNPVNRAIIQVDAIETCMGSFAQRLKIYMDIIEETEKRFFEEIRRREKIIDRLS